jgi:hypothetical protein
MNAGMHIVYILIFPRALVVHRVKVKELHTECSANDSRFLKTLFNEVVCFYSMYEVFINKSEN